jgi:tetratricopeptide (TPR) repeat protein
MLDTVLCSCGSGLRRVRCCDYDPAALPERASLDALNPMADEATKLYNEKKPAEAGALALKILDLAPNHRAALRVLFEVRRAENKPKAAEALARRLASLPADGAPIAAAANLQLAQLLVGQGRHLDAEPSGREALKLSSRDPTAHHVMGVILTETGRLRAGESHYRRALALLEREDGMVLANLAWNLKLQGKLGDAAEVYDRALLIRPDNARGIGGYAQVEAARGRPARAASMLDEALVAWPADRTLRLLRALVDLQLDQPEAVLARLNDPVESLMPAEFAARGQAFGRLNQPAEAVTAFAIGKRMQRERYGQRYEPEDFVKKSDSYKAYFTADRILALPRAAFHGAPQPVFLLGFPRSGTSLLEQLLAKIPGFAAGDSTAPVSELTGLVSRLTGLDAEGYPESLSDTMVGDAQQVAERLRAHRASILAAAGLVTEEKKFITDRSPDNHWHLGLIKLLYPEAPIIHLLRHPLDLMLSNLGQDRRLEANAGVSMPALAQHYDLTMSLIRHFRGQLTLRYFPLRYETLVESPVSALRDLLSFIGADPATVPGEEILRANDVLSRQPVPAHVIMQEPLHRRGLYRYRAYESVLPALFSEVRPVLAPWIAELGYAP